MGEGRPPRLISRERYLRHLAQSMAFGAFFVVLALGIGIVGYHVFGRLPWLDSLYNASMILSGMGPVDGRPVIPTAEKWFASFYALFSGVTFLVVVGVMFAPFFHRILHKFHLMAYEDK